MYDVLINLYYRVSIMQFFKHYEKLDHALFHIHFEVLSFIVKSHHL